MKRISSSTSPISISAVSAAGLPRSARTARAMTVAFCLSIRAIASSCAFRQRSGRVTPERKVASSCANARCRAAACFVVVAAAVSFVVIVVLLFAW